MKRHNVKSGGCGTSMRAWLLAVLIGVAVVLPAGFACARDFLSLRVAVAPSRPPFSFRTETGVLSGFDVSLAQAVCHELRRACLVTSLPTDQALEGLAAGDLDMVVAGIVATPEVTDRAALSEPYYRTRSVFVARADRAADARHAFGRVGSQTGSLQYAYLARATSLPALLLTSSSLNTLWAMLRSGTADAVLVDSLLGYAFLMSPEGRAFDTVGVPLPFDQVPGEFHIALPRKQYKLIRDVNQALQTIKRNGVYLSLSSRYFSIDID